MHRGREPQSSNPRPPRLRHALPTETRPDYCDRCCRADTTPRNAVRPGTLPESETRNAPNSPHFLSLRPGTVPALYLLHGIEPRVGPGNISNAQRTRVELGDRAHESPRSWG